MKSEFIFDQESDLLAFDVKGKRRMTSYDSVVCGDYREESPSERILLRT